MILKASNILKQKLFTEGFFKKAKSMLSLQIMGMIRSKGPGKEMAFKVPHEFSFGKIFNVLKHQLTARVLVNEY